jgi:hypothetical protein
VLCALVCAPFGVVGLGFVAIFGLLSLARFWVPVAVVVMVVLLPIDVLLGWFFSGDPWGPTGDGTDEDLWRTEGWKAFPIFLAAIGILGLCYYLGGWQGVVLGGAAVGALIGAILSILSQWPAWTRARKRSP